jgi:uncharacterized protein
MILPVKRIPDGHSVLSQKVEFNAEQAQWLAARDLACRAEIDRIRSQLHVHAFYSGSVLMECARCLKPVDYPVQGDFRIVCVHRSEAGENREFGEHEIDFMYDDATDEIDLTPLIYEEIMTSLPMKPLCSEDCPGIGGEKKRAEIPSTQDNAKPMDPRWEGLKKLKIKD